MIGAMGYRPNNFITPYTLSVLGQLPLMPTFDKSRD